MTKKKFVLTERDIEILYLLFRFKTVGIDEIHQEVFPNVHYSAVTRRLRKLEMAKLIRRDVIWDEAKRTVSLFSLTLLGLGKLKVAGNEIIRRQIKSNFPQHDLKFMKLALGLSKFGMVNQIITENELLGLDLYQRDESFKDITDVRPDGILKLNVKGHPFLMAVEYEFNAKSASRWREKLAQYYCTAGGIDAVFYFCETPSMMKKLMETDREIAKNQQRRVFFCHVLNADFESQKVTLVNSQGLEFVLN